MGFPRQEYRSGLPCPPPGDLLDPGIKTASLMSPTLGGKFFATRTTWEARGVLQNCENIHIFLWFKPLCLEILSWQSEQIKIPHKMTRLRMRRLLGKMGREERKSLGVWGTTLDDGTTSCYLLCGRSTLLPVVQSTVHQLLCYYSQRCSRVMQVDTT